MSDESQPPEPKERGRRVLVSDPEVIVMGEIADLMEPLSAGAKSRVACWIKNRFDEEYAYRLAEE